MIYFYLLTFVFYIYFVIKNGLNVLSPFVIFGLFSFIYSFFPWLYLNSDVDIFLFSGNELNNDSAEKILFIQAISNIAMCFLIRNNSTKNILKNIENKVSLNSHIFSLSFWVLYPLTLILVYLYPWGEKGVDYSIGSSIAAAFKTLLLISFCIYCNVAKTFGKVLAFLAFLFLCFIDTSRTTLFILIFLFAFYTNLSWKKLFRYLYLILPLFFLFVWITLKRNDIDFEFKYILWVFYTESLLGGYSTFQSIRIVEANYLPFQTFLYPIADLFIYLIPSFFFNIFEIVKSNSFLTINLYKSFFDNGFLFEEYSPMGGHYYIAEFYLYFKYFTPVFVFLYFHLFFKLLKFIKYKEVALIIFCSSFLLVKASIFNNFKFFLSIFILAICLLICNKLIKQIVKFKFI